MKPETLTFIHDSRNADYASRIDKSFFSAPSLYVNGDTEHCFNDYHLPVEYLLKKYFPNLQINHIKDTELVNGQRSVYKLSFRYFVNGLAQKKAQVLESVPKSVREDSKALLLFNDAQEYSYYDSVDKKQWKPFVERVFNENIADRLLLVSGNKANHGLQIGTGKTGIWPLDNLFAYRLNPVQGYRYFEEVVAFQKNAHYPTYSYAEKLKNLEGDDVRLFLHLNRVVKDFRVISVYLLWKNKLLDHGFVSHAAVTDEELMANSVFWELKSDGFSEFLGRLPMVLDTGEFLVNQWDNIPFRFVNKSFLWLVSETLFDRDCHLKGGFMTEKTYKPISLFMPFVMMGSPYTLKRLRNDGYETFSKWWDESYDEEVAPTKRMQKIIGLLDSLKNLSNKQMRDMYIDMKDVLEHNAAALSQTQQGKTFAEALMKKYYSL